jgi:hypothetical protein
MELILTRLRDPLDKQLPAPVPTSPCVMHYHRQSRYDYSEDWEHENGQYSCTCANCHQSFLGHKRRCLCRVCDPPIKSK